VLKALNKRLLGQQKETFNRQPTHLIMLSKIYKEVNLIARKQIAQFKNWAKDLNRHFSKRILTNSQRVYEIVLKITNRQGNVSYYLIPVGMGVAKKVKDNEC
jgi:hypothetical protein